MCIRLSLRELEILMPRPHFQSIKSESQEQNSGIVFLHLRRWLQCEAKVQSHLLTRLALLYSMYSLVSVSATIAGGIVSWKKWELSEEKIKPCSIGYQWAEALVSKISTAEQRTPPKQNESDATFKVNEKELNVTTDRPFSKYLIKGQTA